MSYARRLADIHVLADFRKAARRRLPKIMFDYVDGAAGRELTAARNRAALDALALVPADFADVTHRSTATRLFGQDLAMPVIIGPTGLASGSWPLGELALARAAHAAGIPFVLANAGSVEPEKVAEAGREHAWFQLYPPPDRKTAEAWIAHIKNAGFTAMEVTVDVPVPGLRPRDSRNRFTMPFAWAPRKVLDVARRPEWAFQMLRHGAPTPYLTLDSLDGRQAAANQSERRRHRFSPALSWENLSWIRDAWSGPLILKGLMNPLHASKAMAAGYDSIVISNHGGRQLDGAPATMDVLPDFVSEVGGRIPILIDGGFSSGVDVIRALALGASGVQLGRAIVFALAVAGQDGVAHALRLLTSEIDSAMAMLGLTAIDQVNSRVLYRKRTAAHFPAPHSASTTTPENLSESGP